MSDRPMFSVILPTWNRYSKLCRALRSLRAQTYANFEVIVIDDGSREPEWVHHLVNRDDDRFKLIRIEHQGRVIARNTGMEAATGDWLCWLDSDDALDLEYLNTFRYNIEHNPEVKLWVCGAIVHGVLKDASDSGAANVGEDRDHVCPRWTKLRHAWKPPVESGGGSHKHFTSGKVGTGMFVFHRSLYGEVGPMPSWINHLQVCRGVNDWLGYDTGYGGPRDLPVGNPWGDDWVYFRALTMRAEVSLIEACLYVHYVR